MVLGNVPCKYCSQTHTVRKHGMARSGYQRYFCVQCCKTFQRKYIYNVHNKRESGLISTES